MSKDRSDIRVTDRTLLSLGIKIGIYDCTCPDKRIIMIDVDKYT